MAAASWSGHGSSHADQTSRHARDSVPQDSTEASALVQIPMVAQARGLDPAALRRLVEAHVEGRSLGLFGEPHVNVLDLDMALKRSAPASR
jgi:K+-transporting ATPase ATPase C chain